jgi:Domain of unknown function (DUF4136)
MGWNKHIVLCAASVAGCYAPPASEERFDDSIIVTSRDDGADFGTFQTFFIRPDIRVLDENLVDDPNEALDPTTAAPLIDETRQNLIARGYTEATEMAGADLAVELVYARTIYSDYYCYYWYDWGYWGYPGYYYYYPYSCDTVAWRSGMLATNVTNLSAAGPAPIGPPTATEVLRGVWFSGVYGVESDSSAFLVDRAMDGIDQAFLQSPYFSITP